MTGPFHTIGRPHRRVDGLGKVTGATRFAADLAAPGMLYGAVLTSRRTHARIVSLDLAGARAMPGVRAVLSGSDLSFARRFGVVIANQPVLVDDRIRQYGDGIALVAAETMEEAERALEEIRLEVEELPGVYDPEAAMLPGAPVIHDPPPTAPKQGSDLSANVFVHHHVRQGNTAEAWERAEVVLERTFRTQHIEHAYIEPEAVLAEPSEDGGIRVTGSIQNIYSTRRSLASVLGCIWPG